jgi:hypothetical protein
MTRINNTDQMFRLLRAKLEQASGSKIKAAQTSQINRPKLPVSRSSARLKRTKAIAIEGKTGTDDIGRHLISGLLIEVFGEKVENEAAFQEIVDQAWSILQADSSSQELVRAALAELVEGDI